MSTAMLVTVVAIFGTIAYRAVRQSTLQGAREQLNTVARALAQPTPTTGAWIRTSTRIAAEPPLADAVASSGARAGDSARMLLRALAPDTGLTLAAELRAPDGRVVLSVASAVVDSLTSAVRAADGDSARPHVVRAGAGDTTEAGVTLPEDLRLGFHFADSVEASPLVAWRERVVYERAVPVRSGGQVVGHLVEVRLVSTSPNAVRQLQHLIGQDAALVVGNVDGSVWTNLSRVVQHPPPADSLRYTRDGRIWLGATARLASGPWVVSTELPEDVVLAPVRALRWKLLAIGFAVVALAALVAAWLSRWLTTPLARLTTAAEGIAGGDRTVPRVVTDRRDEIGRLERAFAVMAENVHASRDTLEHSIGERTNELTIALERLRATQDELLRKERLATLGHVSSSIAHELRNPLGVMTNVLFYLDAVLAEAPPKVRDYLAKLKAQVTLSESIITGLLDVTRTNAANPGAVSVRLLVDEQLERVTVPPTLRVQCDIPADLPDLWVDRLQIGQVLLNLVVNAVQAMADTPGILSITARRSDDLVRIAVADTGPGIPADHLEKIFEPLFTTKARGIGLGLSVSRSLASANRGSLTAANRPDGGALFILKLPVAAEVSGEVSVQTAPGAHTAVRAPNAAAAAS